MLGEYRKFRAAQRLVLREEEASLCAADWRLGRGPGEVEVIWPESERLPYERGKFVSRSPRISRIFGFWDRVTQVVFEVEEDIHYYEGFDY